MLKVGQKLLASAFEGQSLIGPRAITLNEENLKENVFDIETQNVSESGMIQIINSLKKIQVPEDVSKNFETYNDVKKFIRLLIVSTHPDRAPQFLEQVKSLTKFNTYLTNYVRKFHNDNFDTKVTGISSKPREASKRPSQTPKPRYEVTPDTAMADFFATNRFNSKVLGLNIRPLELTDAVFKEMIYKAKIGAEYNQYEDIYMPKSSGVYELDLVTEFLNNLKPGTKKMHIVMTNIVLPMERVRRVRAKVVEMRDKLGTEDIHVYFTRDLIKM